MSQFHFDPDTYLELMASEVPDYERFQSEVAAASSGPAARRILELGTGTGETARRVLARHPGARLVGIDESEGMLQHARRSLPEADLRVARLQDPLPDGPFDLVISALTVHHLDGPGKADLFARVAGVLTPGGRFVLGDVVVPEDAADAVIPLEAGYDLPSRVDEQLGWLTEVSGSRRGWPGPSATSRCSTPSSAPLPEPTVPVRGARSRPVRGAARPVRGAVPLPPATHPRVPCRASAAM